MKLALLKTLIFALYLTTSYVIWRLRYDLDRFFLLVAVFTLAYCGIIVLSQLISELVAFWHRCVAASRKKQEECFTVPSVEFETETEAT